MGLCSIANAQNYLVPNPETARWSYIETDSKGVQVATVYHSVESLQGDALNGKLKLLVEEIPFSSPDEAAKSFIYYRFKDGEYILDGCAEFEEDILSPVVYDAIKQQNLNLSEKEKYELYEKVREEFITGEIRGIPRCPKVGDLPDYEFRIKVSIMSMTVLGKDRRIVGTETIQTAAGTFDCFIMEETLTMKAMMMKEVTKTRSWYAYGIGLVKEISYDKKGRLVSTLTLNEINW